MREIKKAALIGLGAIGGFAAPGICKALGSENFCVIAGGERRKRLERDGLSLTENNGNSDGRALMGERAGGSCYFECEIYGP
ncbi:hypothetical protein [Anaerostipes caccae]|uniref:hypothetical protein n=1 Tax=Anaerostipes caccae TaxID=105841 RepID=UPI003994D6C7